ncbi:Pyrroline-5-carboxylate reductase [Meristemomyces frigidus]|nr:Pyrroline-5-carboxylate reductase [Meristemomyces frigidus]
MERDLTPDWILKQTLSVQQKALMDYVNEKTGGKDDGGLTLTMLGCGTLGSAILGGILDSLSSSQDQEADDSTPKKLPTRFHACVRSPKSGERIRKELGHYPAFKQVQVHEKNNVEPVRKADVVLLGCKPYMVADILKAEGMREALAGKLLISILAGVKEEQIQQHLSADCTVVRAMPNTAAAVRESMTVIATSNPPLPKDTENLVTWIFTRVGRVTYLPASNMDACTALCGSGPGFVALMAESLAMGAIAMGVPRDDAYLMAAQTMRGTTGLLLAGEHPAMLRDKVMTPGGCTIGGLLVLEEGAVRGTIAKAVREATVVASQLGQGQANVNGTRRT